MGSGLRGRRGRRPRAETKDDAGVTKSPDVVQREPEKTASESGWVRELHQHGGLALTTIGTIAAAVATVSTCQQTSAVLADRTTPYKIALFETRTDEFRKFSTAGQRLDASFRKALFVIPIYMETESEAAKMTDAQLEEATAKVAFMIDEYTSFQNDALANGVGWTPETTVSLNEAKQAAEDAMGCYFAFGPAARPNMPPEYWAIVRSETSKACPYTRSGVVRFNKALLKTYNLMEKDIKAVTLPTSAETGRGE